MTVRRTGRKGGSIAESDRLRSPFLRMVGRRHASTVFRELGISPRLGGDWLMDLRVLSDAEQMVIRTALDESGVQPSPAS